MMLLLMGDDEDDWLSLILPNKNKIRRREIKINLTQIKVQILI